MKKTVSLIFTVFMLVLLVACNHKSNDIINNNTSSIPTDNNNNTTSKEAEDNNVTFPDDSPAPYTLKTYSVTDEYGNAGTYTEINTQYHTGDIVRLEAMVNSGYNFVGWFINDTCISKELTYNFKMKASDFEIEARYDYYTVSTFSYSNDYENAGIYTELKNKKFSVGEQVTVEATVNAGYNFEGWFINDVCVSKELIYSFVMKEKDVDLETRWSCYTVTVECYTDNEGMAGTYTKMDNQKFTEGSTVTLNATVADGYNFEGWYIDDVCVCKNLTYQFVMEKSSKHIYAEYSCYTLTTNGYLNKSTYTYDALTERIGSITKYDHKPISNGQKITLVATLGEGYTFKGWFMNGICVCEDLEYTYTMTENNVEIQALFTYYTVDTSAFEFLSELGPDGRFPFAWHFNAFEDSMGTYTKFSQKLIKVGDTVTLTATTKEGYAFLGWKHGDVIVSYSETYTFVMEASDTSYEAVFVKIESET